jgi:hypothetical protein
MPAYTVHRPSVARGGQLIVRIVAVAALLAASVTALIVLERGFGGSSSQAATSKAASHAAAKTTAKTHVSKAAAKTHVAKLHAVKKVHVAKKPAVKKKTVIPAPTATPVAVLNGGTSQGAAAATAARLRALGYPVPLVGNAGRRDLPSAIEYTQGLGAAARALARRIGPVSYVTPFDGPVRNLSGARLLVIIGS